MIRNIFLFFLIQALEKGIDVPKMNDHELRCNLNDHNVIAGPVIGKSIFFLRIFYNIKMNFIKVIHEQSINVNFSKRLLMKIVKVRLIC